MCRLENTLKNASGERGARLAFYIQPKILFRLSQKCRYLTCTFFLCVVNCSRGEKHAHTARDKPISQYGFK